MPDWKKLIAGKIAIAKKGNTAGKSNTNIRIPAGQTQVNNFPVLDLGSPKLRLAIGICAFTVWSNTSLILAGMHFRLAANA